MKFLDQLPIRSLGTKQMHHRWWFQRFFVSTLPGEMIQFDNKIFYQVSVRKLGGKRKTPELTLGVFDFGMFVPFKWMDTKQNTVVGDSKTHGF